MLNKKLKIKINSSIMLGLLCLGVFFLITNCDPDETQDVAKFNKLVMFDDFNGEVTPNHLFWNYDIGTGSNGWGNNELQYYTDRPENVLVQDGVLTITARQEDFEGSSYTSGRILTKGKFEQTYGRFEARIKLPWGQGLWPAFWILGADIDEVGWPQCGEIDAMENRGQEPTLINGTVHGPGYSGANGITKPYELTNDRFDTGFHIFGIEWGSSYINFYVDGVLYNQITPDDVTGEWVYDHDFFIIMNLAVGGNYVGSPDASTVFPQEMIVDYVKVYSAD